MMIVSTTTSDSMVHTPLISEAAFMSLLADVDFLFFHPVRQLFYIGSQTNLTAQLGPCDETLEGFYAQPFFDVIEEPDGEWAEFSFGSLTYPYQYSFQVRWEEASPYEGEALVMVQTKESYEEWKRLFEAIQREIAAHRLTKVVASRRIGVSTEGTISIPHVLRQLVVNNPQSFIFAYRQGAHTFLGATPEILVEKTGATIQSYALAGTVPKPEGASKEALQALQADFLKDEKNGYEHRIVVDTIREAMAQYSETITVSPMHILTLKNLYHLKTDVVAKDTDHSLLEWVQLLHPTPAMGGKPRKTALDFLKTQEPHERGLYAAPLGVRFKNGDGTIVVGIRSALVGPETSYAYAGCGIIEASDCESEYREIDHKLRTVTEAISKGKAPNKERV